MRWTLGRARVVVLAAVGVVACAVVLGGAVGTEFLPQLDEGVIWIRSNLPSGISLEESAETAGQIRQLIRQSPEVKMVMSQTGRNDSGMDPFGPNRNEFLVQPYPYSQWPAGKTKSQLVDELAQRLNSHIPGASFNITQPIIDTSTEIATGSSADLAVIINGPDLSVLRRLASQVVQIVRGVDGAADTSIEQEGDQPQLRLAIDRAVLARYGLNISDVQDVIELAIGGRAVGSVFEGERRFDVTVRYLPDARADPASIGQILVATPGGGRVPLGQLAHIETVRGPSIIARRENERQITVRTNIRGRDQGGFVSDAQAGVAAGVKFPSGYRVDWGGQFENLARARARLAIILPITVVIVFALLFVAFASVKDAGLVLVNVPFSFVGGIVALYARGIHLSVSAAVGFITLFGVAVMGGLLYVAEINRRLKRTRNIVRGGSRVGREVTGSAHVHVDPGRHARDDAGRSGQRHRIGHSAASSDGDRGRPPLDHVSHASGAAEPLLPHRRLRWSRLGGGAGGAQPVSDKRVPEIESPAKALVMIFDARDEWEGIPLHEALVGVLEDHGIAGATVIPGIMGYGAHRGVHHRGLIGAPHDKPVILLVIEHEAKLRAALPTLRPMVAEGVFVLIDAEVVPLP